MTQNKDGKVDNKIAKKYLKDVLATFRVDPANSMYQAGYEAAIKDALIWIEKEEDKLNNVS